ncbi:MAG: hypothetical protein WED13_03060, partial [Methyloceanibacter sp.]
MQRRQQNPPQRIAERQAETAFKRLGTPSAAAQYGFYYTEIAGLAEFTEGGAEGEISGVEAVDPKSLR